MIHRALTIAGSDSSGGAGIQADLKVFAALKVYGMSVVTAVTAQSTVGVDKVFEVPSDVVSSQIDAVLRDIPTKTVKIGMLFTAANVKIVAEKMREHHIETFVLDPVTVSSSGETLLQTSGFDLLKATLLPMAFLATPNVGEAEMLAKKSVRSILDMEVAAREIWALGPKYVLVKGGHLGGASAVDVLFDGSTITRFSEDRVKTGDVHGSGCVLSAAITAHLAKGVGVEESVASGKDFVTNALRNALPLGAGPGPCNFSI